jgi:membrane-bound ClpP family serine protease
MPEDSPPAPPSKIKRARRRAESLRQGASELQHRAQTTIEKERARRGWVRTLSETWDADRLRGGGLLAGDWRTGFFCGSCPLRF